jgi:homoaconitase
MGLASLLDGNVGARVTLRIRRKSGESLQIETTNTLSKEQINWLRAGSALNYIRSQIQPGS